MLTDINSIKKEYLEAYKNLLLDINKRKNVNDTKQLDKAFVELVKAKAGKLLPSGKDIIYSSIDAARIAVNDIGLGRTSLISLFIFKSGIHFPYESMQLEKDYGQNVAVITKGLAKLDNIEEKTVSSQAENFRRLLLNLAKDVRVILIILAEKLEYMRELKNAPIEEQIRVASEAAYLYAPLAHRLGLYLVKSEMEDISLKFTDKETYLMIAKKLDETMVARNKFIDDFISPIKAELENQSFTFEIKGRPKSIHSIWNKMQKKQVEFEDIYDLFAIRIILNSDIKNEKADCWQVYSAVTDIFQPNPLRLRDWISVPKTNGYESLHTTVVNDNGKWVEVQIRTVRMNEIAEKGVAAHWKYKGGASDQGVDNWLTKIREILETPETDADNFIDDFKLSLYSKEIFVFTPKGDLKKFPKGATVLDFAYDVHSQVGSTCTGAKVNNKAVPIRYKLQNGDKIEVLTTKSQKPKVDWLNIVTTSRAQKKIRQLLNEEKSKGAEQGKEIVKRRFKNWKIDYNDEVIRLIMKQYKLPNAQEFYFLVSNNKIDLAELKDLVSEAIEVVDETSPLEELEVASSEKQTTKVSGDILVIDEQVNGIDYKLAKCCNPIMGDRVFGFVTILEGIKIHRSNCPNAAQLIGKYGYRIVSAKWTRKGLESVFSVNIKVSGEDQLGIMKNISEVFAKDTGVTVSSIKLDANEGAFNGIIGLIVRDLNHLDTLLQKLSSLKGIYSVSRLEGKA